MTLNPVRTAELLDDKVATAKSLAAQAEQANLDSDLPDTIHALSCLAQTAESALRTAVDLARDRGATWQQIGDMFGVTRQAAQERFTKKGAE